MARAALIAMLACGLSVSVIAPVLAQTPPPTTPPPVPKPFPGSTSPPGTTPAKPSPPPAQPTPPPAQTTTPPAKTPQAAPSQATPAPAEIAPLPIGAPSEAVLGVKLYPGAEFLESFDAGFGQRLYLYGTNATFLEVVTFYKGELRTSGRELFKTPPMQQFDLDKFVEEKMAYPPSVVVKDYTWTGLSGSLKDGYLFVDGTTEKRFKTILQVVPAQIK